MPTLTEEQEKELRNLKQHFPYRIVWGYVAADGNFQSYASFTKREMNKAIRAGFAVFSF